MQINGITVPIVLSIQQINSITVKQQPLPPSLNPPAYTAQGASSSYRKVIEEAGNQFKITALMDWNTLDKIVGSTSTGAINLYVNSVLNGLYNLEAVMASLAPIDMSVPGTLLSKTVPTHSAPFDSVAFDTAAFDTASGTTNVDYDVLLGSPNPPVSWVAGDPGSFDSAAFDSAAFDTELSTFSIESTWVWMVLFTVTDRVRVFDPEIFDPQEYA